MNLLWFKWNVKYLGTSKTLDSCYIFFFFFFLVILIGGTKSKVIPISKQKKKKEIINTITVWMLFYLMRSLYSPPGPGRTQQPRTTLTRAHTNRN